MDYVHLVDKPVFLCLLCLFFFQRGKERHSYYAEMRTLTGEGGMLINSEQPVLIHRDSLSY